MNKNMRVMYLRDKNYRPVGCVAMHLHSKRRTVRFQVSTWNPVDEFDRALARQLALGRMVDSPNVVKSDKEFGDMFAVTMEVMTSIANGKQYPSRARKAAAKWVRENKAQAPIC